jgi:hypothetical protein
MNIASVNGSNANNLDSKTGFVFGVTAEVPFTEKFLFNQNYCIQRKVRKKEMIIGMI